MSKIQAVQTEKKKNEPIFHIVKRGHQTLFHSVGIRVGAILLALAFLGVFTLILLKENPITAYKTMFEGVFGNNTAVSLRKAAILLCIALALTPAFKMRFWNTGAEGQVLIGAFASAACMFYLRGQSAGVIITAMLITSVLAGALWGFIPAFFKAIWGTNETLFTLMMNSVAACITLFFMKVWNPGKSFVSRETLDPTSEVSKIFTPDFSAMIIVVTALVAVALLFIYLKYSKHGYEISVVGESENTARYIGINVRKVIIRTMTISGLICGLTGFLIVAPSQSIASTIVGGQGFTAIMVAWLAKFNPIVMILTAFLFIFVSAGGQEISATLGYDAAYSDVFIGIMLFFIIGCEFFINYKIELSTRGKKLFSRKNKKEEN